MVGDSINNETDLQPIRPEIYYPPASGTIFTSDMDPSSVINDLIKGRKVLVLDYFFNGLQILRELKSQLLTKHNRKTFHGKRKFRKAYREASHNLLVSVTNHRLDVRKAPVIGWFELLYPDESEFLISFPNVQGLNSSWQWYQKGLDVEVLDHKIHPYYGVYFPTRFNHLTLFNQWLQDYSGPKHDAIDIGVGCGILSFLLLKHQFSRVTGIDINPSALISTDMDSRKLGYTNQLKLIQSDLFAEIDETYELIIFNPPWLAAQHELNEGIDQAIYYENKLFPRFFAEAKNHLKPDGRIVLLFSNLGQKEGINDQHPIRTELENNNRFQKSKLIRKQVRAASKQTRRKSHRSKELVEMWVLTHQLT